MKFTSCYSQYKVPSLETELRKWVQALTEDFEEDA